MIKMVSMVIQNKTDKMDKMAIVININYNKKIKTKCNDKSFYF